MEKRFNTETTLGENNQSKERAASPQQVILESVADLVSKLNPSTKMSNWDEVAQIFTEDIGGIITEYLKLKADNETMSQIVENDPRLAKLILDIAAGKPLKVALNEAEITAIDPLYTDEDYELYNESLAELQQRRREAREHRKICERNHLCTKVELKRFIENQQMTAQQAEEFFDLLEEIIDSVNNSYIDGKLLKTLWLGLFFENEVEKVKEASLIEGRNQRIESDRASKVNDSLPSTNSPSGSGRTVKMGYIERVMAGDY